MRKWYVVYTHARQEKIALIGLMRQGYEGYLPFAEIPKQRKRAGEFEPLFPRYLFLHLDKGTDNWRPIQSTRGVIRLVRFGNEPIPISDVIIEAIRGRENEQGAHYIPSDHIHKGDRVRIKTGPFKLYEAIVHSSAKDRINVLLAGLGKDNIIAVQHQQVEIIN